MNNLKESPARKRLTKLLDSQIVLLDGPMGTMIQSYDLNEQDFKGERFKDWEHDLKGNNDLLNITKRLSTSFSVLLNELIAIA